MMNNCPNPPVSRRRLFWATQPDACGVNVLCGADCGVPGLVYATDPSDSCGIACDNTIDPACDPTEAASTISTANWLQGLVINMMMTDGRLPDNACGYRPGSQGGHWSESYIEGTTPTIGTLVRTVSPMGRTDDLVNEIVAYAQATLARLVEYGVALSVNVEGSYLGSGRMMLEVIIYGRDDRTVKVGLVGERLANSWAWN